MNKVKTRFQDWGTIEGHLDMITVHRQPCFRIYPAGVARGVECHFEEHLFPRVRDLLGRRVGVWGRFIVRAGFIERIYVKEIEALETKGIDEIRPKGPLWPGQSYEELRRWSWEG